MVIFHGYVSLPEGIYIYSLSDMRSQLELLYKTEANDMIEVRSIDLFNGLIQSAQTGSQFGQFTWLMMWLVGMNFMGKYEFVEQTYDLRMIQSW